MNIAYKLAELYMTTAFKAEFMDYTKTKEVADEGLSREQLEMIWDVMDALWDTKQSEVFVRAGVPIPKE